MALGHEHMYIELIQNLMVYNTIKGQSLLFFFADTLTSLTSLGLDCKEINKKKGSNKKKRKFKC